MQESHEFEVTARAGQRNIAAIVHDYFSTIWFADGRCASLTEEFSGRAQSDYARR